MGFISRRDTAWDRFRCVMEPTLLSTPALMMVRLAVILLPAALALCAAGLWALVRRLLHRSARMRAVPTHDVPAFAPARVISRNTR
jgi:hypothetical protein